MRKNGGRLFQHPPRSGVWWIDYRDPLGKRRRKKIGRRADAELALRDVAEGKYPVGHSGTFRELADYAIGIKALRLRPRSIASDRQRLGVLLPALGRLPVERVTGDRLEQVFGELRANGLTGSTVNRYRSLVSSIFTIGVRFGRAIANPCARVKPYRENANRVRYLLKEEETRLREVLRQHSPARLPEFDLALYTGMRRGEQYSLKWKDVDLGAKILTVRGKTGRRFITVNAGAKQALEELGTEPRGVYVCPETKSDQQRDWRRWLEKGAKEAAIEDFHWHDLRHTYASRLVMKGVDLRTVQELLGHKNITTTMRYAHLSPDHRQAAAEKIGPIDNPVSPV